MDARRRICLLELGDVKTINAGERKQGDGDMRPDLLESRAFYRGGEVVGVAF